MVRRKSINRKHRKYRNRHLTRRTKRQFGGNKHKIKIFCLSLHQSVTYDFVEIVNKLYGNVSYEFINWNISNSNNFNTPPTDVKHINQNTWRDISLEMINKFQNEYDSLLKTVDLFVVGHTPVFSMIYEKYKKPIIIMNTCRYDQPFCWNKNKDMLDIFHKSLNTMIERKQCTIISNNLADKEYLLEKSGIISDYIPSLCLYMKQKYNPIKNEFLMYESKFKDQYKLLDPQLKSEQIVERPSPFNFKDIPLYRGIIHFPYDISSMSLFEQYFAGIPLFFPEKEFYKKCIRTGLVDFIVRYDRQGEILPDDEIDKWLKNADYYNFKFINTYNSFEDCIQKVKSFNDIDKEERLKHVQAVIEESLTKWKKILDTYIK